MLKNIFHVPDNLQSAPPEQPEEAGELEAEIDGLWTQLQHALATKRELGRKVAAAQQSAALWEAHKGNVQQLAGSHAQAGLEEALQGTQRLTQTLEQGWALLRNGEEGGAAAEPRAACGGGAPGPRGLQQRAALSQRRGQIGTVSLPDLQQLSSMLTAN